MIKFLDGKVEFFVGDEKVVINVSGIGFIVRVNPSLLSKMKPGDNIRVYTSLVFNPSNFTFDLYGFETFEKCELFDSLRSVSKIGPKTAMKMLSTLEPKTIISMIVSGNLEGLSRLPGIGKKGAERIIIELKNRFDHVFFNTVSTNNFSEAIEALKSLGYSNNVANNAVRKVFEDFPKSSELDTSDIVKRALKYIISQGGNE